MQRRSWRRPCARRSQPRHPWSGPGHRHRWRSLRQTEPAIQDIGSGERAGRVARVLEALREGDDVWAQLLAVVAHSVGRRQQPGHDGRVRRQRDGCGGDCLCEPQAVLAQRVDVRRRCGAIAVAREVVGARRVEGDDQQVEPLSSAARSQVLRSAGAVASSFEHATPRAEARAAAANRLRLVRMAVRVPLVVVPLAFPRGRAVRARREANGGRAGLEPATSTV